MKPLYMYYKRLKQYIDKKTSMTAYSQNMSRGSSVDTLLSRDSKDAQVSNSLNPEEAKEKPHVMVLFNLNNKLEVQKKVFDLKNERAALRITLDLFQKNFTESKNRKIKYSTDIQPVAQDFKKYKELKIDISKLEEAFKSLNVQ